MKKYIVTKVEDWAEEEIYAADTFEEAKAVVTEKYPEAVDLGWNCICTKYFYATDEFDLYIEEQGS